MSTSPIRMSAVRPAMATLRHLPHPYGSGSGDIPVPLLDSHVKSVDVNTAADLILGGALAAIWLTAGLLADGMPVARTAAELRRRAGLLSTLVGGGVAVFVAVPVVA